MIHQLLNLERSLFVFDTETTGIDVTKDRIVEFGFQEWTADGLVIEWRSFINPLIPIPTEVTAVHGITDTTVKACKRCGRQGYDLLCLCVCPEFEPWPTFKETALWLAKRLSDCDFAGKNVRFDLRITAAEMEREGIQWSYADARIIDAERLEQLIVPRTLSDLYEKYTGKKHDGAHGALSDARASTEVLERQLTYDAVFGKTLNELHAMQWPGWIDSEGKFRFVDGVARFGQWGKYAGKPMRAADKGYWDWVIASAFPSDVKRLAADAKLGKFPGEE